MNRCCFVLAIFISLSMVPLAAIPQYELINLGTLGGDYSHASGINNSGQIVGRSTALDGSTSGFYWDEIQGMQKIAPSYSRAISINDSGQAVVTNSSTLWIWDEDNGLTTAVPNLFNPHDMNNSGRVVGTLNGSPFFWDPVTGLYMLSWGGNSALGINDLGQIVGRRGSSAVLWGETNELTTVLSDLGDNSLSRDINNNSEAVGYSQIGSTGERHAILWDLNNDTMLDLGALSTRSSATGINNNGQVIGYDTGIAHAFLWAQEFGMQDLNDLLNSTGTGWTVQQAWEINDYGWIAATALNTDGEARAVLLRPVPEPTTLALLTIGGLMMRKRKS